MQSSLTLPSTLLSLLEPLRSAVEFGAYLPSQPLIKSLGDGHAVLVLPGFMAGDASTLPLRRSLKNWGYKPRRWRQGVNLGPDLKANMEELLDQRLEDVFQRTEKKVSIIGWSLGGIYARELARKNPDKVRQVITLGSPLSGNAKGTKVWKLYEALTGKHFDDGDLEERMQQLAEPIHGIPITSIYSRSDGLVAPEATQIIKEPLKQNIQVMGSHIGMGHHPFIHYLIADRLEQAENSWQPFSFEGWRKYIYD